MLLNHLDLSVPDVARAAAFFTQGFGFTLEQTKGRDGMAVLRGEGGFVLVLTRAAPGTEPIYPKTFHIGFLLPGEQAVRDAYERLCVLESAEAPPPAPPREMRGGLLFYCHAPGGILVEVGHRPDD